MKNKIITIFIILICLLSIQSFVHAEEGNSDLTWTDCSNATVEIKDYFDSFPKIYISNINLNNNSSYYYCITAQNTKPITDFENVSMDDIYDTFTYMNYELSYFHTNSISKYLELNQDLYFWLIEIHPQSSIKYNYIIEGKKLDRNELPTDYHMFDTPLISYNSSQIFFNTPWDIDNTQRKINLKIGKIEDISILNKLKNKENDAFQKLLEYSKTSNTIYNNQLSSTKSENMYYRGYFSNTSTLLDSNLLQNKAYYFLYAQLDDENGKYYPVEAITFGQVSMHDDGSWYIFFDDAQISWDNLGDINPIHQTTTPSTTDTTLAKKSIPFAGSKILIIVAIIILILLSIIGQLKYKKYKDIK